MFSLSGGFLGKFRLEDFRSRNRAREFGYFYRRATCWYADFPMRGTKIAVLVLIGPVEVSFFAEGNQGDKAPFCGFPPGEGLRAEFTEGHVVPLG
jgi:hypothetical protein